MKRMQVTDAVQCTLKDVESKRSMILIESFGLRR